MIAAGHIKTWLSIIINILPIAFAVIGTVAADAVREEVVKQDVAVKKNVSVMKNLQTIAVSLADLTTNAELKKKLENLAEEFRYSDPVSSSETISLEEDLEKQLEELKNSIMNQNYDTANKMCIKVLSTLKERNKICAATKK